MGCTPQSLLSQGRWLGEAETERSSQICDNLSVSLRLTAPLGGEPWIRKPPPAYRREGVIYGVNASAQKMFFSVSLSKKCTSSGRKLYLTGL